MNRLSPSILAQLEAIAESAWLDDPEPPPPDLEAGFLRLEAAIEAYEDSRLIERLLGVLLGIVLGALLCAVVLLLTGRLR